MFREAAGLTQEQLAEKANLSVNFIGAVERGVTVPSLKTCERIARAMHVSLYEFFQFDDEERHQDIEDFAARLKASKNPVKVKLAIEVGKVILK